MQTNDKQPKTPEELKKFYGREYVDKFLLNQSPSRLERLMEHIELQSEFCVADYACGSGMLMPFIASKVTIYVGVDFSQEFIDAANNTKQFLEINNAEFHCSEIKEFCFNNVDRFDCAFAMDFSEHVPDDQWMDILSAIRISLKTGGCLYLHTPNAQFLPEIMKARSFLMKQIPGHIAVRSPEANSHLLTKTGYRINKLLLLPHYNRLLKATHLFSYIPVIGKHFKARIFIAAEK